ncbi:hypothetical protein MKZ38_001892 [Zalerion maritima]|uniref:Uncharacterized protein n=1 Tax=Zalerion maritima TaxID=339359 RepID=A0AAD5RPM5_9PEZI|nr:hypothetical protein MKZ38_001892 [Zalerion maritima]
MDQAHQPTPANERPPPSPGTTVISTSSGVPSSSSSSPLPSFGAARSELTASPQGSGRSSPRTLTIHDATNAAETKPSVQKDVHWVVWKPFTEPRENILTALKNVEDLSSDYELFSGRNEVISATTRQGWMGCIQPQDTNSTCTLPTYYSYFSSAALPIDSRIPGNQSLGRCGK